MTNKKSTKSLERWLDRQPPEATVLRVSARSLGQMVTVSEHLASELDKSACTSLAIAIVEDCDDWADQEGKECKFLIQWFDGDQRPIGTRQHRAAPLNEDYTGGITIDGSPESLLATIQAGSIRKDELLMQMAQSVVKMVCQVSDAFQGRIERGAVTDAENLQLKEALLEASTEDNEWKKQTLELLKALIPTAIIKNQGNPGVPSGS